MTVRTRSLTTDQGTAMPEATLCENHWDDKRYRKMSVMAAAASGDAGSWRPVDTTDNPEVGCLVCGAGEASREDEEA